MSFSEHSTNNLTLLKSSCISATHGFTTRYGGVSSDYLSSLNLGENRGDDPENVRENYHRLCQALGLKSDTLVFSRQVHENEVRIAAPDDLREVYEPLNYEADGLVTAYRGLPLIVFTADCVPVLLCDEIDGVIGAVHCGWRSSVGDILGVAVGKMITLGAKPENISAAIGPAIGKCCFETGSDVTEALINWLGEDARDFFHEKPDAEGKFLVDLRAANRHRLLTLGLLPENIDVSEECTMCAPDKFWSHRATKGLRGSQAALIVLPER